MKKIGFILLFTVLMSGIVFAQNKPAMEFEKTEHNFGTIKEEMGAVTTMFEFKNTGKSPLIIQRVASSCGCTTPSYTREPILPGKEGVVSAQYSTVRRPGTFNKTIRVYTNVPDTVYVLTIKGNVTPRQ
ncbi:MAG: DUF1573 domain-containing protein [Fermentimonas sp.]|jgi:hypothetical protein|nr:DUF1573 domain-containing protein [Fermentimonas sp.]NLC86226.1 DUF1573 domain-containing protein [Bacteroidales bacterium]HBT86130.1 hypothetical protein [Porphyromonadaceae bacterium]MDD2931168.1 DUF1573 domain-containing protein [Fermentimonas sp.]MDD3188100.1 DUF1573 domain-containing protein [Fermentimonas sp.]